MTKHKPSQTPVVSKANKGFANKTVATYSAQAHPSGKPTEAKSHANANAPSLSGTLRAHSKSARLLGLLRDGTGASLEDMCDATGWQAHSVRAALTGLRKRGHVIERYMEGTTTVWRIVEPAAAEVPA